MKTTKSILISLLVLAGSQSMIQAQGSRANERKSTNTNTRTVVVKKAEVKKAEKPTTVKTNNSRSNEKNAREKSIKTQVEINSTRDDYNNRTRVNIENQRTERGGNTNASYEYSRTRTDNRIEQRVEDRRTRELRAQNQYREFHQKCSYCSGNGFTIQFNGLRHNRCSHCTGLGYRVMRELYLGAMYTSGHYTIRELARNETDQLDAVLDLSRRQWNRIYNINYEYISRNEYNRFFNQNTWEREIRKVLNTRQRMEYSYYLDEIREDNFALEFRY